MTVKIYDFAGFPNPARVRIALAEKGLSDQVEFVSVNVPEGEHKRPDLLAKNPSGTVPFLELEDGTTISECTAITEYFDQLSGEATLTGQTPKQRALIHMMQRRAETRVLDALTDYFHHATPGLGPDIEEYQCAEWGEYRLTRALAGMRYMDEVLSQSPYVAGDSLSMADITVFAGLSFADFIKVEIPAECVHLKAWYERMGERPSIKG